MQLGRGDIVSFPIPGGRGVFQVIGDHPEAGMLIRVMPGVHPLSDISALANVREQFITFVPPSIAALLSTGEIRLEGKSDVPERLVRFPLFRWGGLGDASFRAEKWRLWDGTRDWWITGGLTPEQRLLPIRELVSLRVLEDRILVGWTPEWDTDLRYWPATPRPSKPVVIRRPPQMRTNEFWRTVDAAGASCGGDPARMLSSLRERLGALGAQSAADVQNYIEEFIGVAYTWDLWGAAYIMNGGCSDDAFLYFRAWLLAQGHEVFSEAMTNADNLGAAEFRFGTFGEFELEGLLDLPRAVYQELAGEPLVTLGVQETEQPMGKPWTEDPELMKRRWSRLWKRFSKCWS
jgi:hypothetical protein